jgi:hypothetical protein
MTSRNECRCEHEFTLVLEGVPELTEDSENALFEAGCDDATISVRFGRIYLAFAREAASLKEAILSAIRCVKKSGVPNEVLRVDHCDLVTQADIARRIDRHRQQVHQYINGTRGPGGFPPPACELSESKPVWYWCEVAHWLWTHDMVKQDVLRDAREVSQINSVLDYVRQQKWDPSLTAELVEIVTNSPGLTSGAGLDR